MIPKPACHGEQSAAAFQDASVARAYQYRPPYPPETFRILANLILDMPRRVLDAGCGTGAITRHLVEMVDHVDVYIESFHGRAAFSRERMTPAEAAAFDAEVRALVSSFCQDTVECEYAADVVWGKPT